MTKITKEQVELCVNSIELGGYVSSDTTNEIRTYITQLEEKAERYEKALRDVRKRAALMTGNRNPPENVITEICDEALAPEQPDKCPKCSGTGFYYNSSTRGKWFCQTCNGNGFVHD